MGISGISFIDDIFYIAIKNMDIFICFTIVNILVTGQKELPMV